MRFEKVVVLAMFWVLSLAALGQGAPVKPFGLDRGQTPVVEVGANFVFLHANAPPAACGCFSMYGGGGTFVVNAPHGFGFVADLAATHASKVDGTTQNITVFNYLFGPRYTYRSGSRFTPYVEGLVGGSNETSNYMYVQNVSALAAGGGGGLSTRINRRIGWTVVEADYIYSRLPHAVNTRQNDLRISSGFTFRFGPR
jgi:outer membrane immunogenic protein